MPQSPDLKQQLLNLPPAERAQLAAVLLESLDLDSDAEHEAEWRTELLRRTAELDDGTADTVDGEALLAMLRTKAT